MTAPASSRRIAVLTTHSRFLVSSPPSPLCASLHCVLFSSLLSAPLFPLPHSSSLLAAIRARTLQSRLLRCITHGRSSPNPSSWSNPLALQSVTAVLHRVVPLSPAAALLSLSGSSRCESQFCRAAGSAMTKASVTGTITHHLGPSLALTSIAVPRRTHLSALSSPLCSVAPLFGCTPESSWPQAQESASIQIKARGSLILFIRMHSRRRFDRRSRLHRAVSAPPSLRALGRSLLRDDRWIDSLCTAARGLPSRPR